MEEKKTAIVPVSSPAVNADKSTTTVPPFKKKKRRIFLKILIILFVILCVFRILLPHIVLKYVNKSLSEMEEYYGHVKDIDISLLRGAYVINDIKIFKKVKEEHSDKFDTIPFFSARAIDLSVQWRALFKGRVVGEVVVENADLRYVKGKHKAENLEADEADFRELVDDLMPLTINHFEINNSRIHYIDPYSSPALDIAMSSIYVKALNLSNVNRNKELLPSTVTAVGDMYGGRFKMDMKLDALNKVPTFDMNASMTSLQLPQMNDFLRAYGNFDVKTGIFSAYTEFAAKDGGFGGYVKPLLKDLDVVQWNKEEGNFKQILWETLVGATAEILQNHKNDQVATKVPISGKFSDPNTNTWSAINYLLRNAFVKALQPSIDNTININHLQDDKKTVLEKVFGDKQSRKEKKAERKRKRQAKREQKKND